MKTKTIAIITLIIIVAALVGLKAYTTYNNTPSGDLPVVAENTAPAETSEPVVTPEPFAADAPDDGIDVSNVTDTETAEEAAAVQNYEQEKSPVQDDAAIKAAEDEAKKTEDAIKNPQPKIDPVKGEDEGVKVVVPTEKEPTPAPEPKKDKDGYVYSKEQAVTAGAAALQNEIDTNGFAWADGYKSMKEELGYTDEFIQSLVQKAKNDPYASTVLSKYYDSYRRDGDSLYLAESIIAWIVNGGNDDGYSGHGV